MQTKGERTSEMSDTNRAPPPVHAAAGIPGMSCDGWLNRKCLMISTPRSSLLLNLHGEVRQTSTPKNHHGCADLASVLRDWNYHHNLALGNPAEFFAVPLVQSALDLTKRVGLRGACP
jgi:hypothetical protein